MVLTSHLISYIHHLFNQYDTLQEVRVWEEPVTIPTYGVGQPEKNPTFLEKCVSGRSGNTILHP